MQQSNAFRSIPFKQIYKPINHLCVAIFSIYETWFLKISYWIEYTRKTICMNITKQPNKYHWTHQMLSLINHALENLFSHPRVCNISSHHVYEHIYHCQLLISISSARDPRASKYLYIYTRLHLIIQMVACLSIDGGHFKVSHTNITNISIVRAPPHVRTISAVFWSSGFCTRINIQMTFVHCERAGMALK